MISDRLRTVNWSNNRSMSSSKRGYWSSGDLIENDVILNVVIAS